MAIGVSMRSRGGFKVWSLGQPDSSEEVLVRHFFDGIERLAPTLVSWNGAGFDLPVLHYRALRHKVQAHRYWEMGDMDQSYKWNNYISRFHWRHVDLMDVLSGFQGRGRVGLDQMSQLLGFPGKLGLSGEGVCHLTHEEHEREVEIVRAGLAAAEKPHLRGYLDAWAKCGS